jgi:sugar phosphate isomerase/epimerase
MRFTRRQWIGGCLAGAVRHGSGLAAQYRGVEVGVQSISFQDRPIEAMLEAVSQIGIGTVELWSGHVEPANQTGAALREWRLAADLDHFRKIRALFDRRRVRLSSYDIPFRTQCTDAEIDRMFEMARAIGVVTISSSSEIGMAARLEEFARKHRVRVGFHNLSDPKSGLFAQPDDYRKALNGRSEYLGVTLDTGHLTAVGFQPLEFLKEFHRRVFVIHLKDRKRNQGPPVPFGQGDTPVREILLAVRDHGWKMPVEIECQYTTPDMVREVGRLRDYVRQTLEGA